MCRLHFTLVAICLHACLLATADWVAAVEPDSVEFAADIAPLLKRHCTKCHGPSKSEGGLNLSSATAFVRGGKSGAIFVSHDPDASLLWQQIDSDQMPPDEPLTAAEKSLVKRWISAGAKGLPARTATDNGEVHWAFRPLTCPPVPHPADAAGVANPIDRFLQHARQAAGVQTNQQADPMTLLRRVSLDVTGLPPTAAELAQFTGQASDQLHAQMVDYYLASPQYGVRWGKYWLDAAGYADSNGYFNADTDRPLAYRYRDYVVRALNADKPWDRFVQEQLAGDALASWKPGQPVTPEIIELLEATHFLRNGQDGSGESDGNPDEVRADRYYALESAMQNCSAALLGLTIQCAKCHDHKFEPITQLDYYRWQAVFYPSFHIEKWVKPNDRYVFAPLPEEQARWEADRQELTASVQSLKADLAQWIHQHRPRGEILFEDDFESRSLAERWGPTAPTDDVPGGVVAVKLDTDVAPAADAPNGQLRIIEGNTQGDSWLSSRTSFDWTPNEPGAAIQVTFDLVDNKLTPDATPAMRIGYLIGLHDFNDNSATHGGNLLIDGHPSGPSSLHLDYPGSDSQTLGTIGATGYAPGHNYGIRVTNLGSDKFRLEQLVDHVPEQPTVEVVGAQLSDGGFGFEYCCGRSFVVDNVVIERLAAGTVDSKPFAALKEKQQAIQQAQDRLKQHNAARPGKIAWAADMSPEAPQVHLLQRGNYSSPGTIVQPHTLSVLNEATNDYALADASCDSTVSISVGAARRLAWARWLTTKDSAAAGLFARVQVNRLWHHHFGVGLVPTVENLGLSGAAPTHPELLEWLAFQFAHNGWSAKFIHRLILNSKAYRLANGPSQASLAVDPNNRLLWRFAIRRLDAEAIRDAMLMVSRDIDLRLGGPYITTSRSANGEVIAAESHPGALRRSLYLNHKRTQVLSFLAVFDCPSIVFNSVRRTSSTMPLQSLALLNSEFTVKRAESTARWLAEDGDESRGIEQAYIAMFARPPNADELESAKDFLAEQRTHYQASAEFAVAAKQRAWQDLCQALLASNEFLYIP